MYNKPFQPTEKKITVPFRFPQKAMCAGIQAISSAVMSHGTVILRETLVLVTSCQNLC